jgi:vacuolar-type H+-ATPase subunit I/STV1
MPSVLRGTTQTLVIRLRRGRSAEAIIAVLDDLARDGILRVADLEVLSREDDRKAAVAVVVVEHLWSARLQAALAEANAELIAEPEPPSLSRRELSSGDRLAQIERLNELRRMGTLTEGEFALAKRSLLGSNGAPV